MTDERQKKRALSRERQGASKNDRPTESPPFDLQALARATAFSRPPQDVPPRTGASCVGNQAPDVRTPSELEGGGKAIPSSVARDHEITLTNEVELERARVASALGREAPRRPATTSVLTMANAAARGSSEGPAAPSPVGKLTHAGVDVGARGGPRGAPLVDGEARGVPRSAPLVEPGAAGAVHGSGAPEITQRVINDPGAEMHERFSLGDYTGALELAELILADDAKNLDAAECSENCRTVLENMYSARLGPPGGVPFVVVPNAHMRWLSMDHRAGFVLSLIDGKSTLDTILDLSGMPRLDALHILHDLVQQKVVAVK